MFTQNYINYRRMCFFNQSASFVVHDGGSYSCSTQYSYNGDIGNYLLSGRSGTPGTNSGSLSSLTPYSPGVYFGGGSTPATLNDYCLESPITSGLSVTNPTSPIEESGNGKYTLSASYLVGNTSESDINIWEIGFFGFVGRYKSSTYYKYDTLFERTVLTEPITIQPGESKIVTYKITFNQTLNIE